MKRNRILNATLGLAAVTLILAPARAQDTTTFFRVVSTTTTVITALSSDGTIVWSNAAVGGTCHVQRTTILMGASNWVDYAWRTVTGRVLQVQVYPNPPSGMVLISAGNNSGTNPLSAEESYDPNSFPSNYSLTVSAFYIDRMEVTKALWNEVRSWGITSGYPDLSAGGGKAANHPVHTVNWFDCVKWCNARSQKDGRTPAYYTDAAMTQIYKTGQVFEPYVNTAANGYRLPTDVQWEYAARGGVSSRRFPWGDSDNIQHARANYYSSSSYTYDTNPRRGFHPEYNDNVYPFTSPVGAFTPNGYGLYDMAGNVWEWCYDWRPGYVGSRRVFRGGCWNVYGGASDCRAGNCTGNRPDYARHDVGFRAVLPPGQ